MQNTPLANDFLIPRHSTSYPKLLLFFETADFPAAAAVRRPGRLCGGTIGAFRAPHFDFSRCWRRRDVIVEGSRLRLLDVLIDQDADDEVLVASRTRGRCARDRLRGRRDSVWRARR